MTTEPWALEGVEVARLIKSKQLSASEVAESHIIRIDDVNKKLNAVVVRTDADARARAQEVDAGDVHGPLAGVAITTKINTDHLPYPMDNGIRALKDNPSASTHASIQGLLNDGAMMLGRTNSPAFALRAHTGNDLHGQTHNPYGQHLTPGGSSGGAGAAVATGMCAIAQGNDVAGSVRWPAFCNGVIGLRPTIGRMPSGGSNPNPRGLSAMMMSTQGPIARTMADIRLGYSAMQFPNWNDPFWVPMQNDFPEAKAPLRVALLVEDGRDMHESTRFAIRKVGVLLEDAGYEVEEISPPMLETLFGMWLRLGTLDVQLGLVPQLELLNDSGLTRAIQGMLPAFPPPTPQVIMQALADRDLLFRAWNVFFEQYPLLVMPVLAKPFMRMNEDLEGPEHMADLWSDLRYTVNLPALAIPSLAFPVGHDDGIPLGVQIATHAWREDRLLAVGDALEERLGKVAVVDPVW